MTENNNQCVCPNCGYCPHCGRSAQPYRTYPQYPVTWYQGPIWIAPIYSGYPQPSVTLTTGGTYAYSNTTSVKGNEQISLTNLC